MRSARSGFNTHQHLPLSCLDARHLLSHQVWKVGFWDKSNSVSVTKSKDDTEMLKCAAFPRNSSLRSSGHTPAGPHLGSVAPVPWPRGPAAVAAPAGFLKDVRTLLTNLAGHDEVNVPFTGLGDKTQALATLSASRQSI